MVGKCFLARSFSLRSTRSVKMLPVQRKSSVLSRSLKSITGSRPRVNRRIPNGCLFAPLQGGHQITYSHPLDDKTGYKRFLKEDLLEECGYIVRELPRYRDYLLKVLDYTVPGFDTCWTFGPELIYRFTAPKEHQTDENKWKCRILRACVELKFASSTITDDIADHSDERLGKPSWKMVSPAGISSAIFDGMVLDTLPYFLVKEHFRNSPGYLRMLETLARASMDVIIGETIDTLSQKNFEVSSTHSYTDIVRLKAGRFVAMQPQLGLLHAGILDEEILQKVEIIFSQTGELIQIWDDFCDYYCTSSQTGKPSCDFKNAGTTWASSIASEYFSEDEKLVFEECYGSESPEKMEVVRNLYDSIDLPNIYIDYLNEKHLACNMLIKDLHHKGLEEACSSWLRWLLGD